jgi:hypothetical protein
MFIEKAGKVTGVLTPCLKWSDKNTYRHDGS